MGYASRMLRFAYIDFWSAPLETVLISAVAGNKPLPDVIIPTLGSATIIGAYALISIETAGSTGAVETYINSNTHIQVDRVATGYINALQMIQNTLRTQASATEAVRFQAVGHADISSRVAANSTINFRN